MRGYGIFTALLLLALLLVTGACAIAEGPMGGHVDSTEACCGLAHCSVIAGSAASIGLWVGTVHVLGFTVAGVRPEARRPLSPPPERSLLPA